VADNDTLVQIMVVAGARSLENGAELYVRNGLSEMDLRGHATIWIWSFPGPSRIYLPRVEHPKS